MHGYFSIDLYREIVEVREELGKTETHGLVASYMCPYQGWGTCTPDMGL